MKEMILIYDGARRNLNIINGSESIDVYNVEREQFVAMRKGYLKSKFHVTGGMFYGVD